MWLNTTQFTVKHLLSKMKINFNNSNSHKGLLSATKERKLQFLFLVLVLEILKALNPTSSLIR